MIKLPTLSLERWVIQVSEDSGKFMVEEEMDAFCGFL